MAKIACREYMGWSGSGSGTGSGSGSEFGKSGMALFVRLQYDGYICSHVVWAFRNMFQFFYLFYFILFQLIIIVIFVIFESTT